MIEIVPVRRIKLIQKGRREAVFSFWATIIGECLPLAMADTAPAGGYLIQR